MNIQSIQSYNLYPSPQDKSPNPSRKAESCTCNTDKVDREIRKLKEKRDQLEQQLRTMKDPEKAKQLKQQLAQAEHELRQKDNDSYRRQHAVFS